MFKIIVNLTRLINKRLLISIPLNYCHTLGSGLQTVKVSNYVSKFEVGKTSPVQKSYLRLVGEQVKQREALVESLGNVNEMKESDKEMQELIKLECQDLNHKLILKDQEILESILILDEGEMFQSLVLEVTAGVGGKEAMLFAGELFEMYSNYCLFKRWPVDVIQEDHSDLGGIRHASLCVTGSRAFQFLRHEGGVHRVQRIPVTEKSGRVHTSTVSVAIIPRPDDFSINIKDKDLRVETKRASGAGGQHVNTTDSAVRITHLPSGIAVECQTDRSQIRNRDLAMKKLEAKLFQIELDSQLNAEISTRKSQKGQSLRNEKIRTYNFHQDRITDHRIESGTTHNLAGFLDGGPVLDKFVENLNSELKERRLREILEGFK